jgi:hypothetical protein
MNRFDSAVSSYQDIVQPLSGYLSYLSTIATETAIAAAAEPSPLEVFASWGAPKAPGLTWVPSVRPDATKELNMLRTLFSLETSQTKAEKEAGAAAEAAATATSSATSSTAPPAPAAPATGQAPKEAKQEGKEEKVPYQEGHFHYKGCRNDTEANQLNADCECAVRISKHTDLMIAWSKKSTGRVLAARPVSTGAHPSLSLYFTPSVCLSLCDTRFLCR